MILTNILRFVDTELASYLTVGSAYFAMVFGINYILVVSRDYFLQNACELELMKMMNIC